MNKKYINIKIIMMAALTFMLLSGCGKNQDKAFDKSKEIDVIQRESGSGTKESLLELISLKENDLYEKQENIMSGTDVMLQEIKNNKYAIGYASYSQVSDDVKCIKIDQKEISEESIQNDQYPLTRKIYLVTNKNIEDKGTHL